MRFATSAAASLPSAASDAAAARAGLGQFEPAWTREDEEAVRAASAASVAVPEPRASSSSASEAPAAAPAPAPPPLLLSMSADELKALAVSHGESAYRGTQVFDSITKGAATIAEIRGIPPGWRAKLSEEGFDVGRAPVHSSALSADGTQKLLLRLHDGHVVEAVGIPSRDGVRLTVCVSSQVGCPMRCSFCATGKGGYARNLTTAEIVGQVIAVRGAFERRAAAAKEEGAGGAPTSARRPIPTRVSNVVFMGMGEPALNLRAVLPALREINGRLGIGARRLTLSTVGVPNTIATRLAAENLQFTLAVSLHAPTQELREKLVPSAKATAEEVQAFAQAHSPERAAAPKEIILVDRMPLTDVGKPAKVQLRLDAARRAYTAALADVTGNDGVSVNMVTDPKQGNRAIIKVASISDLSRQEIENRIRERMKYYPIPYDIEWPMPELGLAPP